jgi:hypothetical protein
VTVKQAFSSRNAPLVAALRRVAPVMVASLATACGGSDPGPPANVAGSYTMSIKNEASTCSLPNWTEGATSQNIPVTISQNGSDVTAKVGGLQGAFLNGVLGSDTFTGHVSGNAIDAVLHGSRSLSSGTCAYTIDATFTATVTGDVVQGNVRYTPNTNQSADCAGVATCSASQKLNGTRPPT